MRLFLAIILLLTLAACQRAPAPGNDALPIDEILSEEPDARVRDSAPLAVASPVEDAAPESAPQDSITIEGVEGDLITLAPEAVDPDGDQVTYEFSQPFDKDGKWQTKEGNAGTYAVTVTASDGRDTTTERISVLIHPTNRAPVIDCPEALKFREGEIVNLDCGIEDPEGEDVVIEYSGWMTANGRETTFEDAGTHKVLIKASDPRRSTEKEVSIIILNTNRPPRFEKLEDVTVLEGELVNLHPVAPDPDGDGVRFTFSEPLDAQGEWRPQKGMAGSYAIKVTASDGNLEEVQTVAVVVEKVNTAPKVKLIPDLIVEEGDTVKFSVDAFDEEGDPLTIAFEGWMDSAQKTTTYDDAGEYDAKVIVSDGKLKTTQTVHITVQNKNRPPVFRVPA